MRTRRKLTAEEAEDAKRFKALWNTLRLYCSAVMVLAAMSAPALQRDDPDGKAIARLCARSYHVQSASFRACVSYQNEARDKLWRFIRFYELPRKIVAGDILDACHSRYFPDFQDVWACVDAEEQSARYQRIDLKAPAEQR